MTPAERDLVLSLVVVPGHATRDRRGELLRHFGMSDGSALALAMLQDAMNREDAIDVEMALIVASVFGVNEAFVEPLVALSGVDWHEKHEDVVSLLGTLRDPAAVPALYAATQWIPGYLDYDESRALAGKAIWALGKMPGEEAEQALVRLLGDQDEIVRDEARHQLTRRAD